MLTFYCLYCHGCRLIERADKACVDGHFRSFDWDQSQDSERSQDQAEGLWCAALVQEQRDRFPVWGWIHSDWPVTNLGKPSLKGPIFVPTEGERRYELHRLSECCFVEGRRQYFFGEKLCFEKFVPCDQCQEQGIQEFSVYSIFNYFFGGYW